MRNRFGIIFLLSLWFLSYFIFYTAFYAGSATYGVDSRFMLQLLPAACMLAAFAILRIGDYASLLVARHEESHMRKIAFESAIVISSLAFLAYPFTFLIPAVAIAPNSMPQQSVILKAMNTFYSEYNAVPQNCLVFSFTPDIWFEVNRSSAQINYLTGANSTLKSSIKHYSCVVFDYGYWCVVPPYHGSTCRNVVDSFVLENLTSPAPQLGGDEVAFYRILNYT
jgi:hypothetical protein